MIERRIGEGGVGEGRQAQEELAQGCFRLVTADERIAEILAREWKP